MQVVIATEMHFLSCGTATYTESLGDYAYWQRYVRVFDAVVVFARVKPVAQLPVDAKRADGNSVSFIALPDYVGPMQGIIVLPLLMLRAWQASRIRGAFLFRLPGIAGTLLYLALHMRRRPYGVRVLGDPAESLNPAVLQKRWAALFRPIMTRLLLVQCRTAQCISYVTGGALQARYPSAAPFQNHYSDVDLPDALFETQSPNISKSYDHQSTFRLAFVGSLAQRYKGLQVLLEAVHRCKLAGLDVSVDVLGGGIHSTEYVELVNSLGLGECVAFHGNVSREVVFETLRSADLFVMPSLTEGMPRAMLEAMACGLPCLGSAVGGIPEILAAEDTFPPGDTAALAELLHSVLGDPARMKRMSDRNLDVARGYRASLLAQRREQFYRALRDATNRHDMRSKASP